MNKSILLPTLVASLIMAGFATAQTTEASAPSPAPADSCCKETAKQQCPESKKTCETKKHHDVLTKEERHRFCSAKEAALEANPSLVGKKGPASKRALCDAILKADPSMKPIMDKLKQNWKDTHKGMNPACDMPGKEEAPASEQQQQ